MSIGATKDGDVKKDMAYYLGRWMVFGALAGFFAQVVSPDASMTIQDAYFWREKLHHLLWGLLFGVACGILFTLLQNKLNTTRNSKVTWYIAIALWFGFNLIFAGVSLL